MSYYIKKGNKEVKVSKHTFDHWNNKPAKRAVGRKPTGICHPKL